MLLLRTSPPSRTAIALSFLLVAVMRSSCWPHLAHWVLVVLAFRGVAALAAAGGRPGPRFLFTDPGGRPGRRFAGAAFNGFIGATGSAGTVASFVTVVGFAISISCGFVLRIKSDNEPDVGE